MLQWAGIRPVSAIAGVIGRSVPSVRAEASRMRLSGIDVPTLRDWWLCPVCGQRNPVSSDRCELCYRRELRDLAHKRYTLTQAMIGAREQGDAEEVARLDAERRAVKQADYRLRKKSETKSVLKSSQVDDTSFTKVLRRESRQTRD